jgi:hypothetical protein
MGQDDDGTSFGISENMMRAPDPFQRPTVTFQAPHDVSAVRKHDERRY